MAQPSLEGDSDGVAGRADRLLRVSHHLEAVLQSVDMDDEQNLADDVIVALKAAEDAYERETAQLEGRERDAHSQGTRRRVRSSTDQGSRADGEQRSEDR